MRIGGLAIIFSMLGLGESVGTAANGVPSIPDQDITVAVEALILSVDQFGQMPAGIDGAVDAIRKRVQAADVVANSAKAEREAAATKVKEHNGKIAATKKQMEDLAKQLASLQKQTDDLAENIQALSAQEIAANQEAAATQAQLDSLNQKIQILGKLSKEPIPAPNPAVPKESADAKPKTDPIEPARNTHWSFQPVQMPSVPKVSNSDWATSPIDHFVLARLEAENMTPSKRADRRTLIRRAYFDLIGLPPTADEVAAFEADESPDAFGRLIDHLLASPHYGERWGRHWLDVARYADTKGYVFQEERRYAHAYTYRDYVIDAFNRDLPYDRFILEQIAADKLEPLGEDNRSLAAMGFMTVGRRFSNNIHDIIDDRIDVVTRGLQGLTVQCGRCHDHKFDPVTMVDYYSLYGIFANSQEPNEGPLLGKPSETQAYLAYVEKTKQLQAEVDNFFNAQHAFLIQEARERAGDCLLAIASAHDGKAGPDVKEGQGAREVNPGVMNRWKALVNKAEKTHHPVLAVWHQFAAIPANAFQEKASELAKSLPTKSTETAPLNSIVVESFEKSPPASMAEVAQHFSELLKQADQQWQAALREHAESNTQAGKDNPPSPTALPNADWEQIRQLLYAKDGPADIPADQAEKLFDRGMRKTIKDLRAKVDQFKATSPAAPPRAMILTDNPNPKNTRIFLRGSPGRMGDEVPRHYLQVLASSDRVPVESGSGRLELAREIASDKNPLTARVLVNRVWLHHFGTAIVKTPSDFGAQGDPPTHPQLLDYLASRFMRDGWSIKALHRLMMLTSTYQQSSEDNPRYRDKDPGNLFVWRMNRRRQDFESLRDSLMVTSGRLDKTAGGASVQILGNTPVPRRTVYGFIDRQNLPGTFRNFDFASPDTTNPQRDFTTVPQQALFMMNSPFVIEQAKELIQRIEVTILKNPADRVAALYRLVYGRAPDADELSRAVAFVEAQENTPPPPPMPVVWQYGYGKFDPATGRLASFQTLPHFTGSAWQGGAELPDPKLGWVSLTESGGHPGDASAYSAVRRWVAPNDAIVRIASKIKHPSDQGDGVIARVVTSRKGQIANWPVRNGQVDGNLDQVEVKKGDALDFIIDCNTNVSFDSFDWAPIIHVVDSKAEARGALKWDAKTEFQGPPSERPAPLDAWGQFAQVLLMSNEFVFVD